MRKHWRMVTVYSTTHFLVDFACAFLIFRFVSGTPEALLCILLYNFCAFALQMPLGIIADRVNRNYLFAASGCLLVGAAYLFAFVPIAAVLVVGIGNALFHIGGGIDMLNISEKRLSALGIFVSPGAFGVYAGTLLGKGSSMTVLFFPLVIVAAAAMIFLVYRSQKEYFPRNAPLSLQLSLPRQISQSLMQSRYQPPSQPLLQTLPQPPLQPPSQTLAARGFLLVLIAAACFFFVVCLRSYTGLSFDFVWKGTSLWAVTLICAVVLGKTAGGFVADRFGVIKTAGLSLGLATVFFLFSATPLAGVAAVFLFNMTMPLTLWAMAKILPGAKGFAFGLLTFGIFIGFLPVYLGAEVPLSAPWFNVLAAVVSLVLLVLGLSVVFGLKRPIGRRREGEKP